MNVLYQLQLLVTIQNHPILNNKRNKKMSMLIPTIQMDMASTDQEVTGAGEHDLQQVQLNYDNLGDYIAEDYNLLAANDALWGIFVRLKFKDISDCDRINICLYKRGDPDSFM